jgi:cytochrome c2
MVYTTESFIERAIKIHKNLYDYSKVNYKNSKIKIIIICKIHNQFLQIPSSHLKGIGCRECGFAKNKSNTNNFIKRAIKIHGNKYDYSKVDYIGTHTKVIITCNEHKDFEQTPNSHLSGSGCNECGINKKKYTTEYFIQKSIEIHGNKYDYSKVDYKQNNLKITIICNKHSEFLQTPASHLNGCGCPICGGGVQSNTNIFIEKANKIHNNRYDYSKANYKKANIKIIIICKEHGEYLQTPNSHLSGSGCIKCAGSFPLNNNIFIEKAIKIHGNKYDYSKVNYKNHMTNVIIICKKHKDFLQTPNNHLSGACCNKCIGNQFSKPQIYWLELLMKIDNIYIQHALNDGEFKIPNIKCKVDGYCKETNTIYEFHGNYWHGNPKMFNSNSMNKTCNMTHGELYKKTLEKEQIIKDMGYNLEVMWELDWTKINKSIRTIQKKFRLK